MAVSLRFLGQAAAKQSLSLPASASPRVLGALTPKTPKTPSQAGAFFEDFGAMAQASKTPKTPGRLEPPSFFGDAKSPFRGAHPSWSVAITGCDGSPVTPLVNSRPPSMGSPFSSASRASRGSPSVAAATCGWPRLLGDRPPKESAQADATEAEQSAPEGARAAYLARKSQVKERFAGSTEKASEGPAPPMYPSLLSRVARSRGQELGGLAPKAASPPSDDAAAGARAAFLARRKHVASRNSAFKV